MLLSHHEQRAEHGFRLRGTSLSRLEVFSDVIFGLALALLVVSLKVPKDFSELRVSVRGIVLFYVYPLKFLFGALLGEANGGFAAQFHSGGGEIPELVLLYGVGFAASFLLIASMHVNAWRQREKLELSGTERLITMATVVDSVGIAGVGLFSCALGLLLPANYAADAGFAYILIAPWKLLTGIYFGRKVRLLEKLVEAPG